MELAASSAFFFFFFYCFTAFFESVEISFVINLKENSEITLRWHSKYCSFNLQNFNIFFFCQFKQTNNQSGFWFRSAVCYLLQFNFRVKKNIFVIDFRQELFDLKLGKQLILFLYWLKFQDRISNKTTLAHPIRYLSLNVQHNFAQGSPQ